MIRVVAVGSLKESYLIDAIHEYIKRLKQFTEIQIVEIKAESNTNNSEVNIKNKEGEAIINKLPSGYNIVLAIHAKQKTSEEFAELVSNTQTNINSNINFIIGGSVGLSQEVVDNSDMQISFSKMTFPHQLMRVILMEQIYRAFKIIHNQSYHK